jgi:hypothetical protein
MKSQRKIHNVGCIVYFNFKKPSVQQTAWSTPRALEKTWGLPRFCSRRSAILLGLQFYNGGVAVGVAVLGLAVGAAVLVLAVGDTVVALPGAGVFSSKMKMTSGTPGRPMWPRPRLQPNWWSWCGLHGGWATTTEARAARTRSVWEQNKTYEISGSHDGEYEDDCLLGCCAV